jgi:hypothetical protein
MHTRTHAHTHAHNLPLHTHIYACVICHSQRYARLEVESAIHPSQRMYCPHKDCSTLVMRPDDEEEQCGGASVCPACERTLCANCYIPDGHEVRAVNGAALRCVMGV